MRPVSENDNAQVAAITFASYRHEKDQRDMQSQIEHQYQLKPRINQYHRDAIRAEQLHLASARQSKRMIGAARGLKISMGTMVNAAYARCWRPAAASLESDIKALDQGITA